MKMKKILFGVIILIVAVAVVVVLNQQVLNSAWNGIAGVFSQSATPTASPNGATKKVAYVQPVPIHIPSGNDVFRVAEAAALEPQFIQVDVNPPNVTPGDIQKMYAIVSDPVPIVSVTATIRTDHETTTVPLSLAGPAQVSELLPQKYYVAKNGALGFLSSNPKIAAQQLQTAGVAFADTPQLKYEGSWKVKDTHNIYYTTIFTAKDAEGRTNTETIAWRDNCPAFTDNANNTISANCTMTYTDGVNGGNITIGSGVTLTLSSGGDLVFNSGHSVNVSGTITISSGEIQKGILSGTDNDGDGYDGGFAFTASGPARTSTELDCYDSNASAYPGQTAWFTAVRGSSNDAWGNTGNSYDYNCDGSATEEYSTAGSCEICYNNGSACVEEVAGTGGWLSSVPSCGSSGGYMSTVDASPGCVENAGNCSNKPCSTSTITQACH